MLICNEVRTDSRLIQQQQFTWRVGIEFIYKSEAERAEVSKYCEELTRTWLGALVPSVVPGEGKIQTAPAEPSSGGNPQPMAESGAAATTEPQDNQGNGGSQAA